MRIWTRAAVAALVLSVAGGMSAFAGTINFEAIAEGTLLGGVATGDNTVTFGVGLATPTALGVVAGVGAPETAFAPNDSPAGAAAGSRFLTDEVDGPTIGRNYFMTFASAISGLSLQLYDFRVDGGPAIGATATLSLYSDAAFTTLLASDVFTITGGEVDGNVVDLAVALGGLPALSAAVRFSTQDIGTGIDNLSFTSVPEPGSLLLLGGGLAALAARLRRKTLNAK